MGSKFFDIQTQVFKIAVIEQLLVLFLFFQGTIIVRGI